MSETRFRDSAAWLISRSPCMGAARTWGRLAVLCALLGAVFAFNCITDGGATSAHETCQSGFAHDLADCDLTYGQPLNCSSLVSVVRRHFPMSDCNMMVWYAPQYQLISSAHNDEASQQRMAGVLARLVPATWGFGRSESPHPFLSLADSCSSINSSPGHRRAHSTCQSITQTRAHSARSLY